MSRRLCPLIAVAGFAIATLSAQAQEPSSYPVKPIRLIVPTTPGSPPDLVGRVIGEKLAAALGQPLVFDNRPGATGIIGLEAVARSAADGYTLGVIAMPYIVIASLVPKMPYDTEKDLAPVALVNWNYQVLAVLAASPVKSVADLVAAAKGRPGGLKFSSGGNGNPQHLAGELFKREANVDITHVPYKGGPGGVLAVLTGDVDMTFGGVGIVSPYVKGGGCGRSQLRRRSALLRIPSFQRSSSWAIRVCRFETGRVSSRRRERRKR